MALEIEDVGLQNQICEDEIIDWFHNIIQVCIQSLSPKTTMSIMNDINLTFNIYYNLTITNGYIGSLE
jgi:hypothetical protein